MGTSERLLGGSIKTDSFDEPGRETPAKKLTEDYTSQDTNILQEAAKRFLSNVVNAPQKKHSLKSIGRESSLTNAPQLYHANTVVNHGSAIVQDTQRIQQQTEEVMQKPLQLSARELPDLEEVYEDSNIQNPSCPNDDELPTSDSSNFRSTSPGRLDVGTRTPRRKVSSVLAQPQNTANSATAAICLFYHSEPLNTAVNDIKTWWSNNMNTAEEFTYSN
ncbi:hypothetical protein M3Y97_00471500 [Aphelenchoides bicaudatus]|nr:hypothetical protein M3Y97_00471500 [Aphelenchoides bicaudatus]